MAIGDPKALAAETCFGLPGVANTGDATAAIRLSTARLRVARSTLDALLVNNVNDDAAVSVNASCALAK